MLSFHLNWKLTPCQHPEPQITLDNKRPTAKLLKPGNIIRNDKRFVMLAAKQTSSARWLRHLCSAPLCCCRFRFLQLPLRAEFCAASKKQGLAPFQPGWGHSVLKQAFSLNVTHMYWPRVVDAALPSGTWQCQRPQELRSSTSSVDQCIASTS